MIREEVRPCFKETPKLTKKSLFNFRLVEPDNISFLDISGKPNSFITPAYKFIRFHNVRAIDLSRTRLNDE